MPNQDVNSLPTPEQSIRTLSESLKTVHPANMRAGVEALVQFITDQMRDPNWKAPDGLDSFSEIEEQGRMFLATTRTFPTAEDFRNDLLDYAKLLYAVHSKAYELETESEGASWLEATSELTRISGALGVNIFTEDVNAHGLITDLTFDPIKKFLTGEKMEEILARAYEPKPAANLRTAGIDACSRFDETMKGYQTQAENILRGFTQRIAALVEHCAAKINPAQREAAGALGQQLETAAEAIKAK
jgi:hypothetical protein